MARRRPGAAEHWQFTATGSATGTMTQAVCKWQCHRTLLTSCQCHWQWWAPGTSSLSAVPVQLPVALPLAVCGHCQCSGTSSLPLASRGVVFTHNLNIHKSTASGKVSDLLVLGWRYLNHASVCVQRHNLNASLNSYSRA